MDKATPGQELSRTELQNKTSYASLKQFVGTSSAFSSVGNNFPADDHGRLSFVQKDHCREHHILLKNSKVTRNYLIIIITEWRNYQSRNPILQLQHNLEVRSRDASQNYREISKNKSLMPLMMNLSFGQWPAKRQFDGRIAKQIREFQSVQQSNSTGMYKRSCSFRS